jgi:hypothetical protein
MYDDTRANFCQQDQKQHDNPVCPGCNALSIALCGGYDAVVRVTYPSVLLRRSGFPEESNSASG